MRSLSFLIAVRYLQPLAIASLPRPERILRVSGLHYTYVFQSSLQVWGRQGATYGPCTASNSVGLS